jgi:hypothetical protein
MGWRVSRHVGRQAARIAATLAISAATIPVALGALSGPSAAATSSGDSTVSTQQVIADAECDVAWLTTTSLISKEG